MAKRTIGRLARATTPHFGFLLLATGLLGAVSCGDESGSDSAGSGGSGGGSSTKPTMGGAGASATATGSGLTTSVGSATSTGGGASGGLGSTGGAAPIGGASQAGGPNTSGGSTACPLPSSFKWTSSGPLATPKSPSGENWVSLKDFTITKYNGEYVVYCTAYNDVTTNQQGWKGTFLKFADFPQMAASDQPKLAMGSVAPTLIYFTPKKQWVLLYQWGFQYATSSDPSNPSSWSGGKSLLSGDYSDKAIGGTGAIDQTVICDKTDCYLFFANDNGQIYRASMPIGNFPSAFSDAKVILTDNNRNIFEAVQVYSIVGATNYLMIIEAQGNGGRYFRAFTADSLGGTFTPMPDASSENTPFAGKKNVTFTGEAWSNDISHGDFVRDDPSETQPIDPCNLRFLYQGYKPGGNYTYGQLPYRPGLLTLAK